MNEAQQMRQALADIAKIAKAACAGAPHSHAGGKASSSRADGSRDEYPSCAPKALPDRLAIAAAQTAMKINPVNGPAFSAMPDAAMGLDVTNPLRIAVMVSKYWGPTPRQLTVSFMESTPADLRARLLTHMNEWAKSGCISFVETQGVGQVRISREGGGYWSYLGTDILHIPQDRQTMNLEAFTMDTPESEYRRVVRHETGHTLGFPHEHMRQELIALIDPNKAYEYFQQTQGWDRAMVDAQVLTPLDQKSIMGTPPDQTSIMCYQLPGSITINGNPIVGGLDINATDAAFDAQIYPKPGAHVAGARPRQNAAVDTRAKHLQPDDWPESDDVPASELALT
jgi:Astacin (Peptidase family M12A)